MLTLTTEIWKPIADTDYEVSNLGGVRSLDRVVNRKNGSSAHVNGVQLQPRLAGGGYMVVNIHCKTHYVHRLVLAAFRGECPAGMEGMHLDGDPTNNCLHNLKWGMHTENCAGDARDSARRPLNHEKANMIRKLYAFGGISQAKLGEVFGVTQVMIGRIVRGVSWAS